MMLSAAEPRRRGLVALFLDGEYAVSVDAEIFAGAGLKLGAELTDEGLHELIRRSDARRAKEKALSLLEHRAHSRGELVDKVSRITSRQAAEEAADRLAGLGLIDDESYAADLAKELFSRRGYAASRVRMELMRRGIGRELAEQAAAEYEPDPADAVRQVVQKKYAHALGDEKGRRRVIAALQRLGYRWEDIKSALRGLEDGENGDEGS